MMKNNDSKTLDYYLSLDYSMEIKKIEDNGNTKIEISIPDLGRYSCRAVGDSLEEALDYLKSIKRTIIEHCLKKGIQIPLPSKCDFEEYSGKMLLRIPKELHQKIAEQAKANNTSINQYLVYLLTKASGNVDIKTVCDRIEHSIASITVKRNYFIAEPCDFSDTNLPEYFAQAG